MLLEHKKLLCTTKKSVCPGQPDGPFFLALFLSFSFVPAKFSSPISSSLNYAM